MKPDHLPLITIFLLRLCDVLECQQFFSSRPKIKHLWVYKKVSSTKILHRPKYPIIALPTGNDADTMCPNEELLVPTMGMPQYLAFWYRAIKASL